MTVPVPVESEWPTAEAQPIINQALAEAEADGIIGKAITPYLLEQVSKLSDQRSKEANIALLLNNARVAARVALGLTSAASR